jgi:hypothetical protein
MEPDVKMNANVEDMDHAMPLPEFVNVKPDGKALSVRRSARPTSLDKSVNRSVTSA